MTIISKVALVAGLTASALIGPAQAAGCLKGAVVGGIAGHYAGHHAVVGAFGGCLVGRHMAAKQRREEEQRRRQQQTPRGGQGSF